MAAPLRETVTDPQGKGREQARISLGCSLPPLSLTKGSECHLGCQNAAECAGENTCS